jgi:hypothetical protein
MGAVNLALTRFREWRCKLIPAAVNDLGAPGFLLGDGIAVVGLEYMNSAVTCYFS